MALTSWLLLLLLLLSTVGGCWGGGFGDVVGESAAPGSGEASWRIKEELGRSGLRVSFPDLAGFFVCRSVPMAGSHGFFCASAAAGAYRSARMSVLRGGSGNCYGDGTGAAVRRLAYSCLEESGWRFSFGVSLLLVESPADLGAPVLLRLSDGFNGRSSTQECIDCFGAPFAAKVGSKKLKWLLQKLPRRARDWLQVVWSLFFTFREGALAGGSGHQYRGSPGECYKDIVIIFIF